MPWWGRLVFMFAVVASVAALVGYYVHRRLSGALALERRGKRWLGWAMALGPLLALSSRLISNEAVSVPLGTAGYAINLSILLMLPLLLIEHGLSAAFRRFRRSRVPARALEPNVSDANLVRPTRRDLLRTAPLGAAAMAVPSVGYGMIFGRRDYDRSETVVVSDKLPASLDGLRVVQLSDIHFGPYIGERELRAALSLLRDAKPDLVALTGDLVDHDPNYAHFVGKLSEAARAFSRYGVVAVSGNHDYYAGIDDIKTALRTGGAHVLDNRHIQVGDAGGRIVVAGVDDLWASRARPGDGPDLQEALRKAPDDTFRLMLCHQPRFFDESAAQVDLQISGHTHGGQIEPAGHLAGHVLPFGWVEGRYGRGASTLYVNRGFGTAGPPLRLGAPPEVSTIILARS